MMKVHDTYLFGRALTRARPWTPREAASVARAARGRTAVLRRLPLSGILDALARTGKLFADKRGAFRRAAAAHLRAGVAFSPAVIESTLDLLPGLLDAAALRRRMELELFLPEALDRAVSRPGYAGLLRAAPKGVVLHVGAGNVFLGILDSLVLGMLTRNVNIVKTSTRGSSFAVLFLQALRRCDPDGTLSSSVAALSWPGGQAEIERAVLQHCDAAFVWGGEAALLSYRRLAPARVRVTGFGPKVSLAAASAGAVAAEGMASLARKVAHDVCLWDQSACASPHDLYFVVPSRREGAALLRAFAQEAPAAFREVSAGLPQGRLSVDESVEVLKARELAKVDAALGRAFQASSFPTPEWTVICEKDPGFRVSPLNRVLFAKCVSSWGELARRLRPFRGLVQSVGVAGPRRERAAAAESLLPAGAARVAPLGRMLEVVTGSPHDGTFPMRELVDWVGIEGSASRLDALQDLVAHARRRSPFYRRHYAGLPEIAALRDFSALPLLDKSHILAHTPPADRSLMTAPMRGGILFASGGSTGSPKHIFYDQAEYEHTSAMLGAALEAAGLGSGDRVANLFVAGNLWSSWLSIEKALAHTRAVSLPIGSALPLETVVEYLVELRATAVVGLPSFLLKVAEHARDSGAARRIPLRRIFYGGESVGPAMEAFLRKVFPRAEVRSAAYATVDAGVVGFQCPRCAGGEHHLFSRDQHLEVLEPGTRRPVPDGGTGELVITCLTKRHMPIIRFRLGDLGRFLRRACPCGSAEPLFEILGRCDDRIHAGGAHVFVSDLRDAIAQVPGLSCDFQVQGRKAGPQDVLRLRVETSRRPSPGLRERLLENVRARCADLAESLERGWLAEPELELLPPGAIARVARTGKIRRVVDLRQGR